MSGPTNPTTIDRDTHLIGLVADYESRSVDAEQKRGDV
jgi:hypothetical protein